MAEVSGNITYDRFVGDMLLKLNLNDDHYMRLLRIASDGMQELNMNYLSNVKNAKLTVDTDTNTIAFPSDYMGFVSISIPWYGRMWEFTRDDRLVITTDGTQGVDEEYDVDDGEGINVGDNGVVSGLGSRGGVNRYFYTIDQKRDRIAISGFAVDHAILRYISSGIDTTAVNYIPRPVQRVLEFYVRFMNADYLDQPQSKIAELERKYKEEVRKLKKFYGPTLTEIRDSIYRTTSQSVRR